MRLTDLREILHYVPRFREKIFVISIDGQIVEDENFPTLTLDIAVLRSLNIRVVIVHGASHQIRTLATEMGQAISNADGTGVTDAVTLRIALTAANRLTHEIIEGLSANDLRAANSNALIAHPAGILNGVDHQFTGRVERVDSELIFTLLDRGIVPVIPPLGFDGDGKTYRVNSDAVALEVALALRCAKLVFITPRDGIQKSGVLLRQLSIPEAEELLKKHRQEMFPEMVSKLEHGIKATQNGVHRVHIINGRVEEGLLAEVFSKEGIGTLVHANEYQSIRRAMKKDVRNILSLIKQSMKNAELARRTRADIEKQLGDYFVFEMDRNPVACIALHLFPEDKKGELACLYVSPLHENEGIGRTLMNYVELQAREKGCHELFCLSTQTFNYFQQKGGFVEGAVDDLPKERREKYEQSGRNSKVLKKPLATPPSG
ncbi:MAG: amino-acid N-acetyltransferase [Verrucomicrobia bacterium]|nr:amino-acid N-acetyltransferase [Verrucomicrobiota bacterium]